MNAVMPQELAPFLAAHDDAERSLLALAAAASLTDALAHDLLRVALGGNAKSEGFVSGLHLCDFVVERNSEWHLAARVREVLVERLSGELELSERLHSRLLELTEPASSEQVPDELPGYLVAGVGRAYHATFLSPEGVRGYVRVADQPLNGQQWLAGNLASEQVRLGVIPEDATEIMFLRGMILYREGRRREAERLLRKVAAHPEQRHEVAVASHLIGRIDGRKFRTRKRGEALLQKSLKILGALEDTFGRAQVLHTLGQLIGRDPRRREEAEGLLRESLGIERALSDDVGRAKALHTLGQLIGRDPRRRAEAEEVLRESLEIERTLSDSFGRAQVLNTLGQLIGRDPRRRAEAEEVLRESLEIGRELERPHHQAQVLYGLSQLANTPPEVAEQLLMESLDLNRQMHDKHGEKIVRKALQRLPRNFSA